MGGERTSPQEADVENGQVDGAVAAAVGLARGEAEPAGERAIYQL